MPLRADIQGLRAVAVLLVVAYHAGLPLPGGFSGVDVFFAISGFVITSTLLRELSTDGRIDLWRFYARRVRRLLPALAVMLTVVALLGTSRARWQRSEPGRSPGSPLRSSAPMSTWRQLPTGYFDVSSTLDPLLHTWTLADEEQFYFFFPLLLLLGWACARRTAAAALVAAISVGSFAAAVALAGTSLGFYSAFTRAWEFGAGALIAIAAPWLARIPPRFAALVGAAGLAAIGLTAFGVRETAGDPSDVLLASAARVRCCSRAAGRPRVCSCCTGRVVGNLWYSWYLWHWPLIVFAVALWPAARGAALVAGVLSLVPAWLSSRYVENPIRLGARFRGRRVFGLAGALIAVPVAASLALLATNSVLLRSPAITSWQASRAVHADQTRGCDRPDELERCLWRSRGSNGRVVLVGDFQAGQFTEPVVRAAARAGYDAVVATRNACPFGAVVVTRAPDTAEACARFNDGTMDALTRCGLTSSSWRLARTSTSGTSPPGHSSGGAGSPP